METKKESILDAVLTGVTIFGATFLWLLINTLPLVIIMYVFYLIMG